MGVTMTAEMAVPGLYHTPQMSLGLYH
jgi:hypothetical protein